MQWKLDRWIITAPRALTEVWTSICPLKTYDQHMPRQLLNFSQSELDRLTI